MAGRDMLTFNVHEGSLEAIVHGYKDGFLRVEEYNNLSQCDNLADMKSQLQVTDYGGFLANEGGATLTSRVIADKAVEKLCTEFHELREWADQPLAQFLDFITYDHMISNVLKLIQAVRSQRAAQDNKAGGAGGSSSLEILCRCHPLGVFPGIAALQAASTVDEMFDTVLCDSPIGPYFMGASGAHQKDFEEASVEYIRGILQKNYIEAFYDFCVKLGGETAISMCTVLEFEADRLVVTITANTIGMKDLHPDDRRKLYPNLGRLTAVHDDLCGVENLDMLVERLKRGFPEYAEMFDSQGSGGQSNDQARLKNLDKKFVEKAVELYKDCMMRQFQYGVFYGWVKLKELEVRNLVWIAECIGQNMKQRVNEYQPIV